MGCAAPLPTTRTFLLGFEEVCARDDLAEPAAIVAGMTPKGGVLAPRGLGVTVATGFVVPAEADLISVLDE